MSNRFVRTGLVIAATVLLCIPFGSIFPFAHAQGFTTVYMTPSFINGQPNQKITVTVNVNIASGVAINEFDVQLVYSGFKTALQAQSISGGNIFQGLSPSPFAICVDGIIVNETKCNDYNSGQVEYSQVILGNELSGPVQGTLFNVVFNVTGTGRSVLSLSYAHLVDPGPNTSFATAHFVQTETIDGVFGNSGLVAFFNMLPATGQPSPVLLPQFPVTFDASASFNSTSDKAVNAYAPYPNYTWNFGDGSKSSSHNPMIPHTYTQEGNYTVILSLSDGLGHSDTITRTADIASALGAIDLTVNDDHGNPQRQDALVEIFNQSGTKPFANQTTDAIGGVIFRGLIAGQYSLQIFGIVVQNKTISENVIEGWTTQDTVYLTLKPTPPNYGALIFVGVVGGGVAIFGVLLVRKRRIDRKKARKSLLSKAKKNRSGE